MELIDREELLRIIDRNIKYTRDDVAVDIPYNVRLNEYLAFKHIILNCKCINAEPVKHGKWNKRTTIAYCRNGIFIDYDEYLCSECQRVTEIKENYCSNCGAKMDLEGEQVETHQVV